MQRLKAQAEAVAPSYYVMSCWRRCDNITISPQLLDELQKSTEPLDRKLTPEK